MAVDYEKVLKLFQERLDYEIERNDNPQFLIFIMAKYANGQFTDEEIAEEKGWRNALKFTREILQGFIKAEEENVT